VVVVRGVSRDSIGRRQRLERELQAKSRSTVDKLARAMEVYHDVVSAGPVSSACDTPVAANVGEVQSRMNSDARTACPGFAACVVTAEDGRQQLSGDLGQAVASSGALHAVHAVHADVGAADVGAAVVVDDASAETGVVSLDENPLARDPQGTGSPCRADAKVCRKVFCGVPAIFSLLSDQLCDGSLFGLGVVFTNDASSPLSCAVLPDSVASWCGARLAKVGLDAVSVRTLLNAAGVTEWLLVSPKGADLLSGVHPSCVLATLRMSLPAELDEAQRRQWERFCAAFRWYLVPMKRRRATLALAKWSFARLLHDDDGYPCDVNDALRPEEVEEVFFGATTRTEAVFGPVDSVTGYVKSCVPLRNLTGPWWPRWGHYLLTVRDLISGATWAQVRACVLARPALEDRATAGVLSVLAEWFQHPLPVRLATLYNIYGPRLLEELPEYRDGFSLKDAGLSFQELEALFGKHCVCSDELSRRGCTDRRCLSLRRRSRDAVFVSVTSVPNIIAALPWPELGSSEHSIRETVQLAFHATYGGLTTLPAHLMQ
jgi:hypothetical protein